MKLLSNEADIGEEFGADIFIRELYSERSNAEIYSFDLLSEPLKTSEQVGILNQEYIAPYNSTKFGPVGTNTNTVRRKKIGNIDKFHNVSGIIFERFIQWFKVCRNTVNYCTKLPSEIAKTYVNLKKRLSFCLSFCLFVSLSDCLYEQVAVSNF